MLMFMILLGNFLVNSLSGLLLFDSGASRSFVSQSFSRSFNVSLGELECLLRVSITNEHESSTFSIFRIAFWRFLGCLNRMI